MNLCLKCLRFPGIILLVALLLVGCRRDEVRVYSVPKETRRTAAATPQSAPPKPKLAWELPEGWEEAPAGGMRIANFNIAGPGDTGAEVSVIALAGISAAMSDIVNMWRQQAGLKPVEEEQVADLVEKVRIGPADGELFDMKGDGSGSETRIVVAVAQDEGVSWFFKMTGDPALITDQRPALLKFLETVEFEYPEASPTHHTTGGPGPGPGRKPHWTVPDGWKEAPPTSMGLAKFSLGDGGDASAEMTVTVLGGAAGGVAANVNRWRRQVGLGPLDEAGMSAATTPFEEAGEGAILVDMDGDQRVLAAIVSRDDQSWFYKMVGDKAVVEAEKAAFMEFVKTVDYSHAH